MNYRVQKLSKKRPFRIKEIKLRLDGSIKIKFKYYKTKYFSKIPFNFFNETMMDSIISGKNSVELIFITYRPYLLINYSNMELKYPATQDIKDK